MPEYWMTIINHTNYEVSRRANFAFAGYKERIGGLCSKVEVGDKLIFYIAGIHKFGAICTVASCSYIDRAPHWTERDEVWPCRFNLKPGLVLPEEKMLDVLPLVPSLSFITQKQKQPGKWGTAFRRSLKRIPQQDFEFIEREMKSVLYQ